jgi:uncharacterized membrane protein
VFKILLALHLLFAVFAIGPLVHAATTAARGVRTGNAELAASSARMLRIYSYASVLVVILGVGLMSAKSPRNPKVDVAKFSDTWIWLSLVLWLAAVAVNLALIVPSLTKAAALVKAGEPARQLTGRVAAGGGAVGVVFAVIVFLMVYRPGG